MVAITIFLYFGWALNRAADAQAHLVRYPDKPALSVLENREASQELNLAHARYVARHGAGRNARWHRLAVRWITEELLETRRALRPVSPVAAIHSVFGAYGYQAERVSYCETGGTFDVNAANGQYLGLFQMGSYARSRYGHSGTAIGQARSAYAYFRDSGSDWSPWACKP
jgi:acetyl-CoA acetyltransferase